MKVLVTGASGQLGYDVCRLLKLRGYDYLGVSSRDMEITDSDRVAEVFNSFQPEAVIHCAAYNFVDLAEGSAAEICENVNVRGTQNVVDNCVRIGAYLISIGTDFVFDGEKNTPYETYDRKNPLSFYGQTKSRSEEIVLAASAEFAVVRTAWLCGLHFTNRGNFVESILNASKSHEQLRVVDDQIGCPTFTFDLAEALIKMLERRVSGIFHATNEGSASRAEFANEILKITGIDCKIVNISSEDYPAAARRPKYSALSKDCLDAVGISRLPHWRDGLVRYLHLREEI